MSMGTAPADRRSRTQGEEHPISTQRPFQESRNYAQARGLRISRLGRNRRAEARRRDRCWDLPGREFVDVVGTSKGGISGRRQAPRICRCRPATHGQHNRLRAPGSIGAGSDPSRVFKGMRMAGQMGNAKTTVQNLTIMKVDEEKNLLIISGSVPGPKNGFLIVEK